MLYLGSIFEKITFAQFHLHKEINGSQKEKEKKALGRWIGLGHCGGEAALIEHLPGNKGSG